MHEWQTNARLNYLRSLQDRFFLLFCVFCTHFDCSLHQIQLTFPVMQKKPLTYVGIPFIYQEKVIHHHQRRHFHSLK